MPLRISLDLVGASEEFGVRDELLHRADVHLARAQAGGADLVLQVLAMREVLRLVRSSAGRRSG